MTVREFSIWTGMYSPKTLRRAIRSGELRAIHGRGPNGKPLYRLELADAVAFLKLRGYNPERVAILEHVLERQTAAQ
jgi:hypothetical protein